MCCLVWGIRGRLLVQLQIRCGGVETVCEEEVQGPTTFKSGGCGKREQKRELKSRGRRQYAIQIRGEERKTRTGRGTGAVRSVLK